MPRQLKDYSRTVGRFTQFAIDQLPKDRVPEQSDLETKIAEEIARSAHSCLMNTDSDTDHAMTVLTNRAKRAVEEHDRDDLPQVDIRQIEFKVWAILVPDPDTETVDS